MKCPYCVEEIQDNAIKCKYCGEWLPTASYLWPVNKTESNFDNLFVLEIEGEKIYVERTEDKTVRARTSDNLIKEISEYNSPGITDIEVAGHKLSIQYKNYPWDILSYFSGFRISVDDKPIEKTYNDPGKQLKTAS